jgi:hypothetical protein
MLSLAILLASMVVLPADTVVVIGTTERDLTGDDRPEILRLVGVGRTVDSLDVTLSIESAGRTVYRARLAPITRTVGSAGVVGGNLGLNTENNSQIW